MQHLADNIYGVPVVGRPVPFNAEDDKISFYYTSAELRSDATSMGIGVYARHVPKEQDGGYYPELLDAAAAMIQSGGPDGNLSLTAETDIGYAGTDKNGNATHMVIIFTAVEDVDDC